LNSPTPLLPISMPAICPISIGCFRPDQAAIPEVAVAFVPLSIYDELAAVHQPAAVLALDGGLARIDHR
jgi:hypothetical protein